MGKSAIKILLTILIVVSLLTACSGDDNLEATKLPDISNMPVISNIPDLPDADDSPVIKVYAFTDSFVMQPDGYIEKWEDNLKDNFGINIDFNYIEWNFTNLTESMANLEAVSALDGFLFLPYPDLFGFLMEYRDLYLLPISDYCIDSGLPSHLSETDKEIFTIDDTLWALSGLNIYHTFGRQYKEEYLVSYPVENLSSVQGIMDYVEYLADNYDDAYFAYYNPNYFFDAFMDLFLAYGLYPSQDYQIGYNPNEGEFKDVVLEPEFKEVFELIIHMNSEKMIDNSLDIYDDDKAEAERQPASYYGSAQDRDGYKMISYIAELNSTNLVLTKPKLFPWVLLKNTKDMETKLNEFIEKIWNDSEARKAFNFGIEGYSYMIEDSGNIKMLTPEGSNQFSSGTALGAIVRDYSMAVNSGSPEIPENISYCIINSIELYGGINKTYKKIFKEFLTNTLTNKIPFERALEIYKADIEKFGLVDVVEKLNNQLN